MREQQIARESQIDAWLVQLLRERGIDLSPRQAGQIVRYAVLLEKWNQRINLVSSTEIHVLGPLILEALWAAGNYPGAFRKHLDIGSGGGFPALPLAVVRTDVEVTLLESRSKKAAFLETAAFELGLQNVRVVNRRADEFLKSLEVPGPWQCVSAKALRFSRKELDQLLSATGADVQLWVFHGRQLPFPGTAVEYGLELICREDCPFHPEWFLSQFQKQASEA